MTLTPVRAPAVAGLFFAGDAASLRAEVRALTAEPAAPKARALGVMVPHAGYVYSGGVCGRALASVEIDARVLILHTKHRPGGGVLSLATHKAWRTPLGDLPAEPELTEALAQTPGITASDRPHGHEHAAEVVLPFLQVLAPQARVAVISVGALQPDVALDVGRELAGLLRRLPALIVASSDMNHYESHERTLAKDELALERMRAMDVRGLIETCDARGITMCGHVAVALMLAACAELGATRCEVLEHTTSGETSGDFEQVVGYASARVL